MKQIRLAVFLFAVAALSVADTPAGSASVDFNSTADQSISITIPGGYSKYLITGIVVYGVSTAITTAKGGVYTGTSKTGTIIVPSGQPFDILVDGTYSMRLLMTQSPQVMPLSATTLYLSLTTPQGSTATGKIVVFANFLP